MTQLNYFCSFFYQNSLLFSITFLNIFVAKCIFLFAGELEMDGDSAWICKFCICWAFTHTDLSVSSLEQIHNRSWSCCTKFSSWRDADVLKKDCFVNEWGFPISNVYKNTSKYLLLVECRFEVDVYTYTVECPETEFCVIGSGWTVYFYINISSLYICIYIFTHIHTLYT